jgi:hypothetical protein
MKIIFWIAKYGYKEDETQHKIKFQCLHFESSLRLRSIARSNRLCRTNASRSHAVSVRGASHDRAAARAISAAASVTPLLPPLPAWASNMFAT